MKSFRASSEWPRDSEFRPTTLGQEDYRYLLNLNGEAEPEKKKTNGYDADDRTRLFRVI